MKRFITIIFSLFLISGLFAFEGLSKKSYTKDGYAIRIYQIDKSEYPKSYEFYVQLTSNNSEEYFTWCFDNLADTMEHFKWLETIEVVKTEQQRENADSYMAAALLGWMSFEEAKKATSKEKMITIKTDRREDWRTYTKGAEQSGNYINYWISKSERKAENQFNSWR